MHQPNHTRRLLLAALGAAGTLPAAFAASPARRPVILWRNAWNTNNIGDIGHVPGALALLRHYIPEAKVILWAHKDLVIRGEYAALGRVADGALDAGTVSRKVIPDLHVVRGELDANGRADNPALDAAVSAAGLMAIGSGAGILEPNALLRFTRRTGKPMGMFGITTDPFNFSNFHDGEASPDVQALRAASFVFTRERTSLRVLRGEDVDGPDGASPDRPDTPVNEAINRKATGIDLSGVPAAFVPDTTFAFAARDEARARVFLQTHGLASGKFICVVPRHRWTPTGTPTRQGDSRDAYNALYFERDCAALRTAIVAYVRQTGNKVALVPETVYVVAHLDAMLRDGLPADVAAKVVTRRDYWLPDEAQSVFAHAQAVVSMENHSPILAAAAGTPFVMVHQPEDSFKSDMFADIGLGDWYIEDINRAGGADVADALMRIVTDLPAARRRLAGAMALVEERHQFGMQRLRQLLALPPSRAPRYRVRA
ncbi:polysaccharide pyruvyl transferase family protein [Pseudoduganella lutea]|uniref:Polysaccharide pyruvyl transferase family protein n=1 Tax=Pseudoduganella lutea TaxID=321985 RepID=A0A4P6KS27_9BURK|nr:polysaccharide pyruvyl transferase family protein [Pseudoduganella lutea]QBE61911.1 polysaccharide pyruvyl transferase family protein [Pseudoduganella lutea]